MDDLAVGAGHPPQVPYGILIVDDEEAILESLEFTLGGEYRVFTASNGAAGLEIFDREDIALVIADQNMPGMTGVEFLEKVVERDVRAIRMMLTGYADISSLARAINSGRIYRYITKPWEPDELRMNVKRALESYALSSENSALSGALAEANERLRAENLYLRQEVERRFSYDGIIGDSPAMQRVFEVMKKVAETDATVLITGETGTGKELVARAIHYSGSRHEQRFVAQNCGALPDTLLESELFGHRRGAFTGANQDKQGLFEMADRGTIFLDEIGETEPGMQVRLLRVLQEGEIRPLGSSDTLNVDVRVLAATNRNLQDRVTEDRFREDLFYRLRVVEIEVPPLRERRSDIPALAHHFLESANERMSRTLKGFSNAAMDLLTAYAWRGNVRELENEIERMVVLAGDEDQVSIDMLSSHVRGAAPEPLPNNASDEAIEEWNLNLSVDNMKRRMIMTAITETGSKTRAAERLGIPRQSLQKMMKRLGLTDPAVES
ncbi:MAG: two-component system response regulator HupR/HoxA [Myxococcota bacterium]|jgi:two-component system response regulator HupR/HoxA